MPGWPFSNQERVIPVLSPPELLEDAIARELEQGFYIKASMGSKEDWKLPARCFRSDGVGGRLKPVRFSSLLGMTVMDELLLPVTNKPALH